jgi:F-type H+-transporting ATPase subunit b
VNQLAAVLAAEEFQAHHWWWPETKEIIWGGLAFLIVLAALIKFALPPLKAGLRDRSSRIAEQLERSANAKADAEAEAAQLRADLADLATRRAQILEDARVQAESLKVEGFRRNDVEMVELEARAEADIAAAQGRSASELQHKVGAWASETAERFVDRRLDDALRNELVEDFIGKVGAR